MNKLSIPYPTLGIDLDGTITENSLLFHVLTHNWPGRVVVVTYRDSIEQTVKDLEKLYIKYDKVVLASSMDKSSIIRDYEIDVYIDDQDEMTQNIPESVTVLKMRNAGNFDFEDKKWLYSDKTGKMV